MEKSSDTIIVYHWKSDGYREGDGYRVPAGYRVQHIYKFTLPHNKVSDHELGYLLLIIIYISHKFTSGTHLRTFDLKLVRTNWFSYFRGPQSKMTLKLGASKKKEISYVLELVLFSKVQKYMHEISTVQKIVTLQYLLILFVSLIDFDKKLSLVHCIV